jgi:Flp pilus assembly pilin Flp
MKFLKEEHAQDLTEYVLLMAFIVIASAAVFYTNTSSMSNIWSQGNTQLSRAASAANI